MKEFILCPAFIEHVQQEIIPEIIGASEDSLAAYEMGQTESGENNFSNYFLGCALWDNNFNRLARVLPHSKYFKPEIYKKVMKIVAQNGDRSLEFYVSRVQDVTRIPKSGKSIKRSLQEQFFLSEEVQGVVSHAGVFIIAYDIDIVRGLGTISLDLLTPISGKVFQSTTIYEFIANTAPQSTARPMPEAIQSTPVKRSQPEKLASEKQSDTEVAHENMGNGRASKLVEKKSQQA